MRVETFLPGKGLNGGVGDPKWDLIRDITRRCITIYRNASFYVPTLFVRNQRVQMAGVAMYAELFGQDYKFRPVDSEFKSHAALADHVSYMRTRGYERKRHSVLALIETAAMKGECKASDADILAAHGYSCQQIAAAACAVLFDREERTHLMREVRATAGSGDGFDMTCLADGLWEGPLLPLPLRGRVAGRHKLVL